jgi:hypothetical protein
MSDIRIKRVMRYDAVQGHFRLFRVMWETGTVGDGTGYSNMVSIAVQPTLFKWYRPNKKGADWMLVLLGVRVHRKVSYGGRFV